jgi:D-ribose pyranose/furanose isomerase RbsD
MEIDNKQLELYVQIRTNTQKIELAQSLIKSATMQHHEEFKKEVLSKIEVLRQNNHTDFCNLSNQLY